MGVQGRGRWRDPEGAPHLRTPPPQSRGDRAWALTRSCPQDSNSCVSMPAYFRFLTLMAFHIFLQEKVRVHSPKVLCLRGLREGKLSWLGARGP